jgi:hypothetical protein
VTPSQARTALGDHKVFRIRYEMDVTRDNCNFFFLQTNQNITQLVAIAGNARAELKERVVVRKISSALRGVGSTCKAFLVRPPDRNLNFLKIIFISFSKKKRKHPKLIHPTTPLPPITQYNQ